MKHWLVILVVSAWAAAQDADIVSRTEYSYRVENFFQYDRLHAGKPSRFRIFLKDVSDDRPIRKAEVMLTVRQTGNKEVVTQATSRPDKAAGTYLATLTIPRTGMYTIEFRIRNTNLDERLLVDHFDVE